MDGWTGRRTGKQTDRQILASKKSAVVFKSVLIPLPMTFTNLTDDEEYHGDGRTHDCDQHEEVEPIYETLKYIAHHKKWHQQTKHTHIY